MDRLGLLALIYYLIPFFSIAEPRLQLDWLEQFLVLDLLHGMILVPVYFHDLAAIVAEIAMLATKSVYNGDDGLWG